MRSMLLPSALALALGLAGPALAQGANMQKEGAATGASGHEATGIVQEVDKEAGRIVVDGQAYALEPGGGATVIPAPGDEVTLFYEDKGGQKVVTRIGQKQ